MHIFGYRLPKSLKPGTVRATSNACIQCSQRIRKIISIRIEFRISRAQKRIFIRMLLSSDPNEPLNKLANK